jgi:hypothetical protein
MSTRVPCADLEPQIPLFQRPLLRPRPPPGAVQRELARANGRRFGASIQHARCERHHLGAGQGRTVMAAIASAEEPVHTDAKDLVRLRALAFGAQVRFQREQRDDQVELRRDRGPRRVRESSRLGGLCEPSRNARSLRTPWYDWSIGASRAYRLVQVVAHCERLSAVRRRLCQRGSTSAMR